MLIVKNTHEAIPDTFKSRTREQFLEAAQGTLSGDDLYWTLYRAASDNPNSGDGFANEVASLLDGVFGAGNYVLFLSISPNESGGSLAYSYGKLNGVVWGGDAWVLPGFGRNSGITCGVFWD